MGPRRSLDAGPLFVLRKNGASRPKALLAGLWSIPH
jgi:hypothetical protein